MTKRDASPMAVIVALAGALAMATVACAELRRDPVVAGGDGGVGRADGGSPRGGATCGNSTVEQGETCDPPSRCPTTCPSIGCTRQRLEGSAATCTARCVEDGQQAICVAGDRCCPAGCSPSEDADCNCTCGNGMVEGACGEKCDPLGSCPEACPAQGCMLRRLVNPGTCQAECADDGLQTVCQDGDGCCPPGCDAGSDGDCKATCGNGAIEAGESCDPRERCPGVCPPLGCTRRKLEGSAAACTARCVEDGQQTACQSGDDCCPSGCNAGNDSDCACTCGNGMREEACGEVCDPPGSCPQSCPPMGCQRRKLINGGTCQARCIDDSLQTACLDGDGCCPGGCNATNDTDCNPRCGNAAVENGEQCDPMASCPSTCPWQGCMRRKLEGAAAMCTARCVDNGLQTACARGDGCCPPACNATNDNDCQPRCGNGVVEGNEVCDGNCPTSCPTEGCQRRRLQGDAAQCSARCVDDTTITTCGNGDGCCPATCNSTNDGDCMCRCGNGVVESACRETCEGASCPQSCPTILCQRRKLEGSAAQCNARCVNDTVINTCTTGDGCCPKDVCNNNTDKDCAAVCGNSVVETAAGETCDPPSACRTQSDACVGDRNTIRTRTGNPDQCTFVCTTSTRPCGPDDGFCPTGCSFGTDPDCPRPRPPPPDCDVGEKCCEPDPAGGCLLCVPFRFSCP